MPEMALRGIIQGIIWILVLLSGAVATGASAQQSDTIEIAASAATRQLLTEAEGLIERGQSRRAYNLLSPHEVQLSGNPLYDYLLGISALDSGRSSEAIFALRRALSVEPGFSGARLELARAYFEAGNNDLARPLFARLLEENPPPSVRDVLNQYITAIDARPRAPRSRFIPYLELFAGHDSNANGSTSDQQFLGFTLSPNNIETESPFAELGAGFDWFVPRSRQFGWRVSARASHRDNFDASFVNATIISGLGGFNWQRGSFFGSLYADGYWGARDGESNENYAGMDLMLGSRLGGSWDLSASIRAGAQRYDQAIEILDVDRLLYTLGLRRRFQTGGWLSLEAIGGDDSEKQNGSPYGNSKTGGRLAFSAPFGNSAYLYASVGSLTSDYDGLFFGATREDDQLTSMVQLEFRDVLTDGLSVIPRVRYVDNKSDVALYEYDRTELGIFFRWTPNQ
jgi:tetratricopeptide (TPR) repeat protein